MPGFPGVGAKTPFHFLTVTNEGLEILGEPSGEKTVVDDLRAVSSLYTALGHWLAANTCHASIQSKNGAYVRCEIKAGHKESMHYGREFDDTWCIVIGHHYWSDQEHDGAIPERYSPNYGEGNSE